MSDYYLLKNAALYEPLTTADLGQLGDKFGNIYLSGNVFINTEKVIEPVSIGPRVAGIEYANGALAADTAGGETVTVRGSGFKTGIVAKIANVSVIPVTIVDTETITFIAPAKSAGNYTFTLTNTDGGVACHIPGIDFSQMPSWVTPSGNRVTVYETQNVNTLLEVVERNIPNQYRIVSGSLPSGVALDSNTGVISGTAPIVTSSTVYSVTVTAADYQNQQVTRNFSVTVNPATVTWNSPAGGASYTQDQNTAFNLTLNATTPLGNPITYSATNLPSGLTLSNNVISGTLTTAQNRTVTLTATASAVQKTASRSFSVNVLPPMSTYQVANTRSGIRNYTDMPAITRLANLWLVPSAIGAQIGDLVFLAHWTHLDYYGEPGVTAGFTGLTSLFSVSNLSILRIGMTVAYKVLDSLNPIELNRGINRYYSEQAVTRGQDMVAVVYRPARPITNVWVHQYNENNYQDLIINGASLQLRPGTSCVQTLDSRGLDNYVRFHLAAGQCENHDLPQMQNSSPGFGYTTRNLNAFKGFWPTSNWPIGGGAPAGAYAYIDRNNQANVSGQLCITHYNKGTPGVLQTVSSGRNPRSWGLEYSQMSAVIVIE